MQGRETAEHPSEPGSLVGLSPVSLRTLAGLRRDRHRGLIGGLEPPERPRQHGGFVAGRGEIAQEFGHCAGLPRAAARGAGRRGAVGFAELKELGFGFGLSAGTALVSVFSHERRLLDVAGGAAGLRGEDSRQLDADRQGRSEKMARCHLASFEIEDTEA